jgi:hypothetical protein
LKQEIELQEQKAMKENIRKYEIRKKQSLDKKKPFDLMTEKRPVEKENNKNSHPVIGNLKITLGPHRSGTIVIREGCDPDILAENFIISYSISRDHKPAIIGKITQFLDHKLLSNAKKMEHNSEKSYLNNLKSVTDISEDNGNYFNIPSNSKALPLRQFISENDDPNNNMMASPHFRGQSAELSDRKKRNAYNQMQPRPNTININDEFNSSPDEENNAKQGDAFNSFHGNLIDPSKAGKRSSSKQSKTLFH